jgi:cutinase
MKSAIVASALATLVVAIPAPIAEQEAPEKLEARQSGLNRNELQESNGAPCPQAIFIYARGSTEAGNMVWLIQGAFRTCS